MIGIGLLGLALIAYLGERYELAFWMVVGAISNGLLVTIKAIVNPHWYWA